MVPQQLLQTNQHGRAQAAALHHVDDAPNYHMCTISMLQGFHLDKSRQHLGLASPLTLYSRGFSFSATKTWQRQLPLAPLD